jgi:hypothetical protein
MFNTFRPKTGTPRTNTTAATSRATSDAGGQYAPIYPALATARRVVALSYRLPGADPAGLAWVRHVEAIAATLSWSEDTRAVQLWRLADWQAIRVTLGKALGLTAGQVERMRPDELAELLAELVATEAIDAA